MTRNLYCATSGAHFEVELQIKNPGLGFST